MVFVWSTPRGATPHSPRSGMFIPYTATPICPSSAANRNCSVMATWNAGGATLSTPLRNLPRLGWGQQAGGDGPNSQGTQHQHWAKTNKNPTSV